MLFQRCGTLATLLPLESRLHRRATVDVEAPAGGTLSGKLSDRNAITRLNLAPLLLFSKTSISIVCYTYWLFFLATATSISNSILRSPKIPPPMRVE